MSAEKAAQRKKDSKTSPFIFQKNLHFTFTFLVIFCLEQVVGAVVVVVVFVLLRVAWLV